MLGWDVERAVLDHLGGLAEGSEVAAPEYGPGLVPFSDAESEEHYWVEDGPGAVGEVSKGMVVRGVVVMGRVGVVLQHAKSLIPFQIMLDVHCRLRLHGKTDQTHEQKGSSDRISLPRRLMRLNLEITLA